MEKEHLTETDLQKQELEELASARDSIQANTVTAIQMRAKDLVDREIAPLVKQHGPCPIRLFQALHSMAVYASVLAWPEAPSTAGIFPPHPDDTVRPAYDTWTRGQSGA